MGSQEQALAAARDFYLEYNAALFRSAHDMGNCHKRSCFGLLSLFRGLCSRLKSRSRGRTLGSDFSHFLTAARLNACAFFSDIGVE